jgi:hypothetical protein
MMGVWWMGEDRHFVFRPKLLGYCPAQRMRSAGQHNTRNYNNSYTKATNIYIS